ncbi:uncharacterized protein LOC125501088 [Athalia rosae]|uniref:uncharacterized protein LOC125501088 n=1 Tax=Athalia rosae TaxID=37344 RepID=UPI0020342CA3|nr:uncharacterized protein LOC125501088 [Athalia rosae]
MQQVHCIEDMGRLGIFSIQSAKASGLSGEKPIEVFDINRQYQQSVNVWAGMLGTHIIGPIFIAENINGDRYSRRLQEFVVPAIRRIEGDTGILEWLQQDGAPPNNPNRIRDYLNQEFPDKWIGLRSPTVPWPPRSPDMTPLDYFYWPYLKNNSYDGQTVYNLDSMQHQINEISASIPQETKRNAIHAFDDRLGFCSAATGGHFEQLIG